MGNGFSRHGSKGEKQRMKEQISELSVMIYSLQQEISFQKSKIEDKEKQMDEVAKEHYRDTRMCNEKVAVVKEVMDRTFNRIENEIQTCKARVEQAKVAFEEERRHLSKLIETQDCYSKELAKTIKNYEQGCVSLEDFSSLKSVVEGMRMAVEQSKESVPQPVRKMIKERSSEWDKEVLDMVEKYQETRGFLMELITLDLSHERDIVGLKCRMERLEGQTSQKSSGEFLPSPSLPDVDRLKSVHSEAPSLKKLASKQIAAETESYQLKFSKISSVMKRMKEEVNNAKCE